MKKSTPPKATVAEVVGEAREREAIARFLSENGSSATAAELLREMRCWWDANPSQAADDPKGWLLLSEGNVVGFLGAFACDYRYDTRPLKGLTATSWYVDQRFRNQSMLLFRRFFAYREHYVLINTTPNETVRAVLEVHKFKHAKTYQRILFLTRQPALSVYCFLNLYRKKYNKLLRKTDRRFDTSLEGITENACRYPRDAIVKDCGLEQLRWMVEHEGANRRSIALLKRGNSLTAYMVFRECAQRGLPGLTCIQSGYENREKFMELLASVCAHPKRMRLPSIPKFVFLNMFEHQQNDLGLNEDLVVHHTSKARHYYHLPQDLQEVPKVCMLAEGDFGRFGSG